jgi:hypothetical protein
MMSAAKRMFTTPQAVFAATREHPVKRNEEGALENEMAITLDRIDRECAYRQLYSEVQC